MFLIFFTIFIIFENIHSYQIDIEIEEEIFEIEEEIFEIDKQGLSQLISIPKNSKSLEFETKKDGIFEIDKQGLNQLISIPKNSDTLNSEKKASNKSFSGIYNTDIKTKNDFNQSFTDLDTLLMQINPLYTKKEIFNFLLICEQTYQNLPSFPGIKKIFGFDTNGMKVIFFDNYKNYVLAIKGTSLIFDGLNSRNSYKRDKMNDILIYSCCCTKSLFPWINFNCGANNVCNLNTWNDNYNKYSYLNEIEQIINYVKENYKDKEIILTGHSLGGGIASLMAAKHNLKGIIFSSPGEKRCAINSGIYNPNYDYSNILNIGMCTDTIFKGQCTENNPWCRIAGFDLETECHIGNVICIFDITDNMSLLKHKISYMKKLFVNNVYGKIVDETMCFDCKEWQFLTT
ncbi:putative lipase [Hamiltosporidium magnivora]|uniref:triacylglycerol lipase n=1 Tax=Hamiltosporidium magnivora TaxID=148818 RepID=A0A4V2JWD7_9MICR|nr:putative lipase [Hamiltosporidium magnivora]